MRHHAHVVPSPAPSPPSSGFYIIEASHKLPTIQATKTLKSVVFSPANVTRYNRLVHHCRPLLLLSVLVAAPLTSVCVVFPADLGRWTAVFACPPALLMIVVTVLALRYDMAVLLLGTFEFWYRISALSIGAVAFAFYMRDVRAVLMVNFMAANTMLLLMDANFHAMGRQVGVSLAGALLILLVATVVAFAWIDGVHEYTVLQIYDHTVTARSVMANSFTLSGILSFHNAYVRRSFAKQTRDASFTTTVQCVVYRCRLRWQPISSLSRLTVVKRTAKRAFVKETIQLRCRGLHQVIDARNTLVKSTCDSPFSPWHWLTRCALLLIGVVGFVSMMAAFAAIASGWEPSSLLVKSLCIISFAATVSVNAVFVCCVYEVLMIRMLYRSFDFAFSLGQVVFVHLCLCDLSQWDERVFALVSSLLWMHWACVIDAIPPIKREQLGLNVRLVAAVIHFAFLIALLLFSADLLAWHSQRFVNREVVRDIGYRDANGSNNANWSVGSFFFNRVVNLIVWLLRSLYRQATYADEELVALRGLVEFDDYEAARRQHRTETSKVKLGAIVQALTDQSHDVAPTGAGETKTIGSS